MSTNIIAIVNQKGGVGKSTTALALASDLSRRKKKVLGIDLDAQANFSYSMGIDMQATSGQATILGVLLGEVSIKQVIHHTKDGDIIPSSRSLSGADAVISDTGKEYRLREAIKEIAGSYDFVVIDTPPALGILTVNALTAATHAIIPMQADIYSIHGVERLNESIRTVRRYCNPSLLVDGILLTRFNARGVLSRDVATMANELAQRMGTRLYRTKIREAIAIKEAQIKRASIFKYAPKANVTSDYQLFCKEFQQSLQKSS